MTSATAWSPQDINLSSPPNPAPRPPLTPFGLEHIPEGTSEDAHSNASLLVCDTSDEALCRAGQLALTYLLCDTAEPDEQLPTTAESDEQPPTRYLQKRVGDLKLTAEVYPEDVSPSSVCKGGVQEVIRSGSSGVR